VEARYQPPDGLARYFPHIDKIVKPGELVPISEAEAKARPDFELVPEKVPDIKQPEKGKGVEKK
jgi:hypothetical protein